MGVKLPPVRPWTESQLRASYDAAEPLYAALIGFLLGMALCVGLVAVLVCARAVELTQVYWWIFVAGIGGSILYFCYQEFWLDKEYRVPVGNGYASFQGEFPCKIRDFRIVPLEKGEGVRVDFLISTYKGLNRTTRAAWFRMNLFSEVFPEKRMVVETSKLDGPPFRDVLLPGRYVLTFDRVQDRFLVERFDV